MNLYKQQRKTEKNLGDMDNVLVSNLQKSNLQVELVVLLVIMFSDCTTRELTSVSMELPLVLIFKL